LFVNKFKYTGSNIFISAYGGEFGQETPAIVTTDLMGDYGYDSLKSKHFDVEGNEIGAFTNLMNGTSAATPMVAGVIALMLEANPNLTCRDVKYILALSARKNDPKNSNWHQNKAGLWFNINYGFGVIDAKSAIDLAKNFQSLSPQENFTTVIEKDKHINIGIYNTTFNIDKDLIMEHVELKTLIYHDLPNDLQIMLTSPGGTSSLLVYPLESNSSLPKDFFVDRVLSSEHFFNESSKGEWKISIIDMIPNDKTGVLSDLSITIYGREK